MPAAVNYRIQRLAKALLCSMGILVAACNTLPEITYVQNPDLPDYKTRSHRIEDPIDLYIEARIPSLYTKVTPRSDIQVFPSFSVVTGPALETALLTLTRQHFSKATPVQRRSDRPTLSYKLLTYKPVVTVVPGTLRTQLIVSARLALQVTVQSATGQDLFSTTAIGTSHVSDTVFAPGNKLKGSSELVEVVTRNAIIDAMYEISKIFGNSSESIRTNVRDSEMDPGIGIETFDDVVLYLRTFSHEPT